MSVENENLRLSDTTIGQIAKILQLALLSGTDIVDHLRQVRLTNQGGELTPSSDYTSNFENNLERMMEEIATTPAPLSEEED